MTKTAALSAPPAPRVRFSLGVTGHRAGHPMWGPNLPRLEQTVRSILDQIAAALAHQAPPFEGSPLAPPRLHTLLADGADQLLAREAFARQWEVVAPLPYGRDLNCAINAAPATLDDARALLAGRDASDRDTQARADVIRGHYKACHLFELADDDEEVTAAFLAMHEAPDKPTNRDNFAADSSERVALAARLVVEQSDLLIAIWDGARTTFVGGTGHTIATALDLGCPVVWIDPAAPEDWRILYAPESLTCLRCDLAGGARAEELARLVSESLQPMAPHTPHKHHGPKPEHPGIEALASSRWQAQSNPLWHAYRRIEALFGEEKISRQLQKLRRTYETPDAIAQGSGKGVLAAAQASPGLDPSFVAEIQSSVLARFAWADGISSHLSDTYRGGMIINFFLSSFAIVGGVAYLPIADYELKWGFALFEFTLLSAILFITFFGVKLRWHGRWFETRRVAEYLRHAPLLLALGAARAPGRWPRGSETNWPEHYARHVLRDVGLPRVVVTAPYLRHVLENLLAPHVASQRDYHHGKARKLTKVHHSLDRLSERMFQIAVFSVAIYLGLAAADAAGLLQDGALKKAAKIFTFLGVMLPTFGGAIAGIRYFGDFERFAAISEITAARLDAVHTRIALLLKAPDGSMDYGPVAELAHAADDIVVNEIENWQAVFGGKHITVPV
jgi:hypothetical protein